MSQTLAVAARELRERWLLFPAGLVVGLAPFLMPSFGLRPEQTPVVGLILAILLGAIAAFVAGASMLARDTVDGRLAFLFSRPVPWLAIWGGKWLAAVVLVFGSAFLALVPVILAYPPPDPSTSWSAVLLGPGGSALFLSLFFMGIGFANFNATAFRSRSAWLALDLGLLLVAIRLVMVWVAPLFVLQLPGSHAIAKWSVVFLGVPALALLVASGAQVWVGRTDLRRAHRALSVAFWVCIFAALFGAGLRLAWARAATPADLTGYAGASGDPAGRWLYVPGASSRGGAATFLIDTDSGRYVPMGVDSRMRWRLSPGMAFAADGSAGIVLRNEQEHSALLHVALRGDDPRFTDIELESSPPPGYRTLFSLSGSGATAVLAHERGVSLYEIPSGRRVATATNPPGWRPAAVRFLDERGVRVWLFPNLGLPYGSNPPAEMRIVDLAVGAEPRWAATPLETIVDHVRSWPHLVSPDTRGRRVLTHDGGLHLRDGATGALLATLDGEAGSTSEAFLADGRVVVGRGTGGQTSLTVFSPEGPPLGEVVLDRVASGLEVGPEVGPGRLAVHFGRGAAEAVTLVVDVDEGQVVETLPHLHRVWHPGVDSVGSAGRTRHFFIEGGAIVRRDFATRDRRVVAGPETPPGERLSR